MAWGKAGEGTGDPRTSAAAAKYGPWDPVGMQNPGGALTRLLSAYNMKAGDFTPWATPADVVGFKAAYPQAGSIQVTVLVRKGAGWGVFIGTGSKSVFKMGTPLAMQDVPGGGGYKDPGYHKEQGIVDEDGYRVTEGGGLVDPSDLGASAWDKYKGWIIGGTAAVVVIALLAWPMKGKKR